MASQRRVVLENLLQKQDPRDIANKNKFSQKLDTYLQEFVVMGSIENKD